MGAWRWEKKAVVFVRKSFSDGWLLWEAVEDSPCPASSKMDLLLLSLSVMVAATSVPTYQEGESCYCTEAIAAREEWESVTETELQTSRSVKEGEKVSQVPEQRFTCSLWCRPRWGSCAPAAHEDPCWSRICLQPVEDPTPEEAGAQRRLWLCGNPYWSIFLKDCTSWKGPTLGQFVKSFSQPRGSMLGKREGSSLWGERSVRHIWWTDCHTHSPAPGALGGEEMEDSKVKLSQSQLSQARVLVNAKKLCYFVFFLILPLTISLENPKKTFLVLITKGKLSNTGNDLKKNLKIINWWYQQWSKCSRWIHPMYQWGENESHVEI